MWYKATFFCETLASIIIHNCVCVCCVAHVCHPCRCYCLWTKRTNLFLTDCILKLHFDPCLFASGKLVHCGSSENY